MKQIITAFLSLSVIIGGVYAQEKASTFTVDGNLKGLQQDTKVYILYNSKGDTRVRDSAFVKDGKFSFKGSINEPTRAALRILPYDALEFFLEASVKYSITGDKKLADATVTAGVAQKKYTHLQAIKKPLNDQMRALTKAYSEASEAKNTAEILKINKQTESLSAKITQLENDFIKSNPNSYVSLFILEQRSNPIEVVTFAPLYKGLNSKVKNSPKGKRLGEQLAGTRLTGIGMKASDITQNNTEGVPVSLSSLKGKYVLLDFWASWCGPCRAENPNVVKAYAAFKDKNFEIFAVSLDDKKERWLKAIEADKLPWIHVSDLKGWKNDAAIRYGVSGVPYSLLIDPNGIIIAKGLRGEALETKLREVLGK